MINAVGLVAPMLVGFGMGSNPTDVLSFVFYVVPEFDLVFVI